MTETDKIMMDLVTRISRIEARFNEHAKDMSELKDTITEMGDKHDVRIRAIEDSLTQYRGFWGAVTIVFGAVVTALTMFWDWILAKLGG